MMIAYRRRSLTTELVLVAVVLGASAGVTASGCDVSGEPVSLGSDLRDSAAFGVEAAGGVATAGAAGAGNAVGSAGTPVGIGGSSNTAGAATGGGAAIDAGNAVGSGNVADAATGGAAGTGGSSTAGSGNIAGSGGAAGDDSGLPPIGPGCAPTQIDWLDYTAQCGDSCYFTALTATDLGVWIFSVTSSLVDGSFSSWMSGYSIWNDSGVSAREPFTPIIVGASREYAAAEDGGIYRLGATPALLATEAPYRAIGASPDGVYVAGDGQPPTGAWLAKYDTAGKRAWKSAVPDATSAYTCDVQADAAGNAYWMMQAMTRTDSPPGNRWLVKMSASGDHIWTYQAALGLLQSWRTYAITGSWTMGSPGGPGLAVNPAGDSILVGLSSITATPTVRRLHADGTDAWSWVEPSTTMLLSGIARATFDRSDNAYVVFWGMKEAGWDNTLTIWKFSPAGDACMLAQGPTGGPEVGPVGIAIQNDRLYLATQRQVGSLNLL